MYLYSALLLGLLGSLHCLGMCGPIAVSLPGGRSGRGHYVTGRVLYNLGRVLTYGVLGAVAGSIGQGVVALGAQRWLSIGLGVALLIGVAMGPRRLARVGGIAWVQRAVERLKTALADMLQRHSTGTLFGIGLLNGLLPCGLVYVGLAGAAATGTATGGMQYMWIFGLGTLPMMLAAALAGHLVVARFRGPLQRVVPIGLAAVAALLIWRGMIQPGSCHDTGTADEAVPACCAHGG